MKNLFVYRPVLISFTIAWFPVFCLFVPAIREYVIGNFMVSAIYNSIIIFIYVLGSGCALFSIWQSLQSKNIINHKNGYSENSLLLSMNKILFSKNTTANHHVLLDELSADITTTRTQRLSFIMSCSNVSTLIGLLGTFAGLSVTIGSIGSLLSQSSGSSDGDASDTLQMIVAMVSSLSEPLRGMNTAFVSSIYGVVCAILLTAQCVFVRGTFEQLVGRLKRLKLESGHSPQFEQKSRNIRIESAVVTEFKQCFDDFYHAYLTNESENKINRLAHNNQILQAFDKLNNHMDNTGNLFAQQIESLKGLLINQNTLIEQNNSIQEQVTAQKNELSNNHGMLIVKTNEINAEMQSYKISFLPLLEKITAMYQKTVKDTLLKKVG
ncbi:MotA/TolQ/ExbB proton channel family protein (plasmid) [Candidatus Fukatsuia symbiotica]|uniref:MotA/TolQ/ExbB proton channel domain-containing protein n=1 Tax=Candidatus Fukatsuia symbiotica TaxID=1878942 RepID=A0A2Y9CKH8_9GAMM|nr:MotA/TolQ/ExbB proton channel family protein [Candidatus Fukatsuia symbiotica]AWK15540.1 hypothetical protein CCS41_14025 [Candidatus Fukatsuia symbiotica]MEA9445931.1 MotA/TolQ/ExbB proton channel family protein [Candidatus Fukatsuia symbiotica]